MDLTGRPSACASLPFALARLRKILREAVAADEASKPASLSLPSRVVTSSMEKPNCLATGATIGMAVESFSKESADLVVDTASTEATRSISVAFMPKPRRAAPARLAASPRSAPVAVASACTDLVELSISFSEKPSRARLVCNSVICTAVY